MDLFEDDEIVDVLIEVGAHWVQSPVVFSTNVGLTLCRPFEHEQQELQIMVTMRKVH